MAENKFFPDNSLGVFDNGALFLENCPVWVVDKINHCDSILQNLRPGKTLYPLKNHKKPGRSLKTC